MADIDFARYGLVDPTPGRSIHTPAASGVSAAAAASDGASLSGVTVGFLWNGKQNGNVLLDAIAATIAADFGARTMALESKLVPSQPCPDEVLAKFLAEADCVVTGPGD